MQGSPAAASEIEEEALRLYDANRYVDSYDYVQRAGGLDALTGPSGRALAGRLAANLGADRYGTSIHLRAWREAPDPNHLGYYAGMGIARLWGPVRALDLLEDLVRHDLTSRGASDLHCCCAYQYGALRDYAKADAALTAAFEAEPDRAWLSVTKGYLLRVQDRPSEAIAAYRDALEMQPMYRPAVQSLADALVQQNEVDEARALLIDANDRMQSGMLALQLAQLEREMSLYESAQERMQAALPMLPLRLKDRDAKGAYAGFAATLAYDVGDIDDAIRLGEESGRPFHKTVVENLRERRETGRRVILDVGFTLQQDVTCVPATISTLTKFWGQPVPQLDIAESICYDGTPAHAERAWLEEQGYFCREFTLTWEVAQALIDAGLPFTQTLTGYTMGHMQAVIGYDSRRGVLIYRDPNVRHFGEVLAVELIEQMRSTGPRGMVFVPTQERERVEALELPDHEMWSHSHTISRSLAEHDRNTAIQVFRKLHAVSPDHRLTLHARGRIASYDGDLRTVLKATDRLLRDFPNDQNQWGVKVRLMRQLGSRTERLEVLNGLCDKSDIEVVYRHQLIEELLDDPHELPRVDYLLRRCMRMNPVDAQTMTLQARRCWIAEDRERALMWTRYAACVELRSEDRSSAYFSAASALGKSDDALAMLRDRFERFADRDSGPAMGLIEALDQVLIQKEALGVLENALKARPEDGELRLYACNYLMRVGRRKEAKAQLASAKGRCHTSAWLSAAARVASSGNNFDAAYDYLKLSLKRAPLSVGTHRQTVQVLADGRGVEEAIRHLRDYVSRYPKSLELRALLVEFSSELGAEEAEQAAREHLEHHPEDAWCWRELGFKLVEQRRWDEARRAVESSERYAPGAMQAHLLRGLINVGIGEVDQARGNYLDAIRVSVDYAAAVGELFRLCDTRVDRQEALTELLQELEKQVIYGETLQLLRSQAAISYEPEEALAILQQAQKARPDLPQASSVVVLQMLAMDRHADALEQAQRAAKQFPLLLGPLLDLATVSRETNKTDDEISYLRRACSINSRDGETLRFLAEAYARSGDERRELAVLQRASQSEPRNVTHRGALAEFHWRTGDRDKALATMRLAIEQEPTYEWGWTQLTDWSFIVGQPELLIDMARAITQSHPKLVSAWLQSADVLSRFPEHAEETYAAIQNALVLDPRSIEAYEQQAIFLSNYGRFDEAIAGCAPEAFGEKPPIRLQARAAVIESQRGDLNAAIASMRGVVDADPHYAWAWSQLASWLQQKNQPKEALTAAKKLLHIAPRAPASWGYVAECLAGQGEIEESKKHLKRSIELDASYLYGGNALLSLSIEAGEYDEALSTLATIGPHLSDYERSTQEAQVYALAKRSEQALTTIRTAIRANAETNDLLLAAIDAMLLAGGAEPLKALLEEEIEAGRASPQAVSAYVEILVREARLTAVEDLCNRLEASTPQWAEAAAAYLDALGDAHAHEELDAFVNPRTQALRKQSRAWGLVGAAFQRSGRHREAVAWMADWAARDDAYPHQYAPLAIAMLYLGETQQVRAVTDHAVALPIAAATDALRVIGASADVLDGNASAALSRLDPVAPQNLPPYYASLHGLLKAASHGAVLVEQGQVWREVRAQWEKSFAEHYKAGNDDLFEMLVEHSRLLLTRSRGNPLRTWFAARKAIRLRKRLS